MENSVVELLFKNSEDNPDKAALILNERVISYAQLKAGIIEAAYIFKNYGISSSDRIILAATNSASFVFGYFAAHLIKAIAIPVDPQISSINLQYIIEQTVPTKIFFPSLKKSNFESIEDLDKKLLIAGKEINTFSQIKSEDIADILFTTGTTGKPKGVVLTHRNILTTSKNINRFIGNSFEDIEVIPLPLCHSFGLGRLRCNMVTGGTIILTESIVLVKKIFDNLIKWNATGFCSVPAGIELLVKIGGSKLNELATRLKYIEIGSAPMNVNTKLQLMNLLPNTKLCMHYGLTEASRSCFIEFHSDKEKLTSVGKPLPNVLIKILDENKNILKIGETGNIYISGEHVMKEYLNSKVETEETIVDNWLKSGDIGKLDNENYLYLLGRQREVINIGGLKVCPDEIEEYINELSFIDDCACIGIPDPLCISGEIIKAFIVLKNHSEQNFSKFTIVNYLRQRVEQYKIPLEYEIISKIPRTSSGKIQRQLLINKHDIN